MKLTRRQTLQGAAATTNVAGTSLAKAFATPTTAGSLLVVAVAWQGTAPLTVTDTQGNSYAVATTAYDAGLGQSVARAETKRLGELLRMARASGFAAGKA